MKYFLLISLIASTAFATQTLSPKHLPAQTKQSKPMPVQASEKSRFIYREFLANREDSFLIQATKLKPIKKWWTVKCIPYTFTPGLATASSPRPAVCGLKLLKFLSQIK
jgi:hypothetical protein